MQGNVNVQRIWVKAKPMPSHPEYYDWQTASICILIPDNSRGKAVIRARQELVKRRWEFLTYEDTSTLIEERVREAGGDVWEAFQQARQGQIFFEVFPDHFGAGDERFRPILPARISEAFMDRVIDAAGGRRLKEDEKRPGVRNADYLIGDFIFELKDLQEEALEKGEHQAKLAALFRNYFPGQPQVAIDPSILSKSDYLTYLDIIGKPIKTHIRSASKQIKATKKSLGCEDMLGGIILLNTGFGTFPHQAFAEQVERYATKDSKQFAAVVSISVWAHTNGFDSYVFYEFSPKDPQHKEIIAIREAFTKRFLQAMTDAILSALPNPTDVTPPTKPLAFSDSGIDFAWMPPLVPLPWERDKGDKE